uniref:Uncharacterized protein n=1 Tax=Arundo donax TaxID=35708 RepID=A0A0A9BDE5_ARUDO
MMTNVNPEFQVSVVHAGGCAYRVEITLLQPCYITG